MNPHVRYVPHRWHVSLCLYRWLLDRMPYQRP
jgi:hypothetical protein